MGMDAYLVRVRNLKQPKQEDFWDKCISVRTHEAWDNDDMSAPAELWYGRKFWDLHEAIADKDYENGEWIEVSKEMLEKMVEFASHNPDYFGGFNSVPALCQALYSYDEAHENGWIYAYECDW